MTRFIVTELRGFRNPTSSATQPGLSCHVLDTLCNHRLMRSFYSEDVHPSTVANTPLDASAYVRKQARELAEQLEQECAS